MDAIRWFDRCSSSSDGSNGISIMRHYPTCDMSRYTINRLLLSMCAAKRNRVGTCLGALSEGQPGSISPAPGHKPPMGQDIVPVPLLLKSTCSSPTT
jgi:hypothetical protein